MKTGTVVLSSPPLSLWTTPPHPNLLYTTGLRLDACVLPPSARRGPAGLLCGPALSVYDAPLSLPPLVRSSELSRSTGRPFFYPSASAWARFARPRHPHSHHIRPVRAAPPYDSPDATPKGSDRASLGLRGGRHNITPTTSTLPDHGYVALSLVLSEPNLYLSTAWPLVLALDVPGRVPCICAGPARPHVYLSGPVWAGISPTSALRGHIVQPWPSSDMRPLRVGHRF